MGVSLLSFEQVEELRSSPYVASVTARQVSFTVEFKRHFFEEYTQGKSPREILKGMGINPEALGESRIISIRMHAMEQGRNGYGFTDRKVQWERNTAQGRAKTTEEKIARYEHQEDQAAHEQIWLKMPHSQSKSVSAHGKSIEDE